MRCSYCAIVNCTVFTEPGARLEAPPKLEVTLDCSNCRRTGRTVIFDGLGSRGICTPRQKCRGFDGTLRQVAVTKRQRGFLVRYEIDTSYEEFVDSKRSVSSSPGATWVRMVLRITCPHCNHTNEMTTQTNLVRPCSQLCSCGKHLVTEPDNPFTFEIGENMKETLQ
jgi:hypothetical protein